MLATVAAALVLTSGLQGYVTRSPITPVCRAGEPCSAPAQHLKLVFVRGDRRFTVTTDARGHYRIALPAGTYAVHVEPRSPVGGLEPSTVLVRRYRFTTRNFTLDTGIR